MLIQFLLMAAVLVLAWRFRATTPGGWLQWLGAVALMAGATVGVAGIAALGRGTTPLPEPGEQARLVQSGVYARLRHPLYTSVMFLAPGWALIWRSWPALAAALALIPFFHAKARHEERLLREKFPTYADYEERVPRFLPRLSQRRRSR